MRFWCALAVLGLVIGVGVSIKFPSAFKASTSVLITYAPDDNPTTASTDLQAIAQSRTVAEMAMRKLGLHESVYSFAAATTATVVTTRILQITVSAPRATMRPAGPMPSQPRSSNCGPASSRPRRSS